MNPILILCVCISALILFSGCINEPESFWECSEWKETGNLINCEKKEVIEDSNGFYGRETCQQHFGKDWKDSYFCEKSIYYYNWNISFDENGMIYNDCKKCPERVVCENEKVCTKEIMVRYLGDKQ